MIASPPPLQRHLQNLLLWSVDDTGEPKDDFRQQVEEERKKGKKYPEKVRRRTCEVTDEGTGERHLRATQICM